jgi:prepilin-type N-terminal cleavage/methylation domain-containing protein
MSSMLACHALFNSRSVRPRHAVTLIELVVVLTIIGVVITLAIPALQSARERARDLVCINNLTQIDLAMRKFLKARKSMQPSVRLGTIGGWSVELMPLLDLSGARNSLVIGSTTDDSVKLKNQLPMIFRCPSRPNQHLGQYSHYAIDYDDENDVYMFFDAPLGIDHPWVSGLRLPSINMVATKGPHRGGFHFVDGVHPVQMMIDRKIVGL